MEWLDLINARHTTFAWREDKIPTEEELYDVFAEVLEHIPSKNRQFPYQVKLLRNDDPEIRKNIMTICQRNGEWGPDELENDRGNPQVLAPWLIGFCSRWVADREGMFDKSTSRAYLDGKGTGKKHSDVAQTQTENIEVGIAAVTLMYALANRGIQTGICQNICSDYEYASKVFKLDEDERAMRFVIIMGVGYGKDPSVKYNYDDPRTGKEQRIPYIPNNVDNVYGYPPLTDIFKTVKK
jgi:nitroreductase